MKRTARSSLVLVTGLFLALPSGRARAQVSSEEVPAPLVGVGIEDRPGAELPLGIQLADQDGRTRRLSDFFDGRRPVVLALAYYECPMLCSLVLKGAVEGLGTLEEDLGPDYRVVVVSIDPKDDAEKARKKREAFVNAYGRPVGPNDVDFLYGSEENVAQLAKAIGFSYRYEPDTKQYAHAAGLFVATPDGRLSRTLFGAFFQQRELQLALAEASNGKVGGALSQVLLFCFHWDPAARSYVLATVRLMKAAGVLTILALALMFWRLWRRDGSPSVPEPAEARS